MQASFLQVFWQERVNLIHSFLNASPSLLLYGCVTLPFSATLSSPLICPSPSSPPAEGEVGRRRQDTWFVSQQRTCLAELRFQPRCQTKSHSVQELLGQAVSLSKSPPPPTTPPLVIVLASLLPLSLFHHLTPSFILSCPENKKKQSNKVTPSTPNKLLSCVFPSHLRPQPAYPS